MQTFIKRNFNFFILFAIHGLFIASFIFKRVFPVHQKWEIIFVTSLSLFVSVLLLNYILSSVRSLKLKAALHIVFILIYVGLCFYESSRGAPFDISVLFYNFYEATTSEGFNTIISHLHWWEWSLFFLLLVALLVTEYKWKLFSQIGTKRRAAYLQTSLCLIAFFSFIFWFDQDRNQASIIFKSILKNYRTSQALAGVANETLDAYPYLREGPSAKSQLEKLPNIFLIFMESFNRSAIDAKANGIELTPVFNRLKDQGLYVENFYSNSVQSSRGYLATLCSVIPSYGRKLMSHYADTELRCLPEILSELGYTTLFARAIENVHYDNGHDFFKQNSIHHYFGMTPEFLNESDTPYIWGWGLQDDRFYQKFFERLDYFHSLERNDSPFFGILTGVSSHQIFDKLPPEIRKIFPEPTSIYESYANAIHFADFALETFLAELKRRDYLQDSMIILVGDHGYPLGAYGNTSNEISIRNDLFEVPLLVLWPSKLQAKRITRCAYSQVDVLPSLLDILKIETSYHSAGQPINPNDVCEKQNAVALIQPYDGTKIASLLYPYKLSLTLSSGKQALFDVSQDPSEKNDLLDDFKNQETLTELKKGIHQILTNQFLIETNRIYPPTPKSKARLDIDF